MTHWPAFIFSSSKCLCCLSAYFTPMSTFVSMPLVFACWKRNKRFVVAKFKMSIICLKCQFLGFTEYSTRLKFSRIEGLVDVPYWPKQEVWSGLASSSRFRRGRWPQRCRWASARRLGWLWWNSQGSLAEGTMVTVRVCFSVKLLVISFSDKIVRDKSKIAWMGPFILTDSSELLYYRVYTVVRSFFFVRHVFSAAFPSICQ